MHRPSRQLVVLTLMTVALCADRAAAATTSRPIASLDAARRIVDELAGCLKRVVSRSLMRLPRLARKPAQAILPRWEEPAGLHNCEGSPFFFRLPPPIFG